MYEGLTVKNDPSYDLSQPVIDIAACKEELNALCERIDSLETFVGKVSRDMDVVESHLDAAKAEIGGSDETFKNMLKPLFFICPNSHEGCGCIPLRVLGSKDESHMLQKKPDPAPPVPTKSPSYEPPKLFRTADYFNIHSKTDNK
uniref:Uncharacterized protein n=1 Tax=Timema cristinae TaxID=61476 RepID=A0A7R9DEK0_TIMCR|nr:unnamed protein product [Timema cristinae]